jgi:hypothetical protein
MVLVGGMLLPSVREISSTSRHVQCIAMSIRLTPRVRKRYCFYEGVARWLSMWRGQT